MKTVHVDHEKRVTFIEYSGTVTDSDLMIGVQEYGRLGAEYSVLIDLAKAQKFDVTPEGLRRVAKQTAGPNARKRCGLIAPTAIAFGLARMFEAFCFAEAGDTGVRVFEDAKTAREWLGLED